MIGAGIVRQVSAAPRKSGLRSFLLMPAAIFLMACAGAVPSAYDTYEESSATQLFRTGLQDIHDIYIEPKDAQGLSMAGLENLEKIDAGVRVELREHQVALLLGSSDAALFDRPSQDDVDGWAALTALALADGRRRSPKLQEATAEQLYEAVFDGMAGQLDRFSRYSSRDEARDNQASRDGFGGIGVRIRMIEAGVEILQVMEQTPAERAGLLDNDIITHIGSVPASTLDQQEVVERLRGPIGSEVVITIDRKGFRPFPIKVIRAHVVPQTVTAHTEDGIAIVRVTGFNQSTTRSLETKVADTLARAEGPVRGLVLDLRGNPGGLLDQAVNVSDLFVGEGRIVSTHGRHPDSHQLFQGYEDDVAKGLPIVVLINGGSASASEIVAAALQDSGRAVVVGSSSYGKGSVQTVLRLPNGGEITLTWARFHAPSGYALHLRGVQPDVCTSLPEVSLDELRKSQAVTLPRVIPSIAEVIDQPPVTEAEAERLQSRCPKSEAELDRDVELAQELLRNPDLYTRALGRNVNTLARFEESRILSAHTQTQ